MYAVLSRKICFKIENLFIKFKNNLYDEKITYMMRKLYIIYIYLNYILYQITIKQINNN